MKSSFDDLNSNNAFYSNTLTITTKTNFFSSYLRRNSCFQRVLWVYHWLYTKSATKMNLKFHFDKQIARNWLVKIAYRRLSQSGVACMKNVTLVL